MRQYGEQIAKTHSQTVECGIPYTVFGSEGFGTAKDDAVYNDQRNEDAKRSIQSRGIRLNQQLDNFYKRRR